MQDLLFAPILFPILMGALLLILPQKCLTVRSAKNPERFGVLLYAGISLAVTALLVVLALVFAGSETITLFHLTKTLTIEFGIDAIGRIFVSIVTIVWVAAGFFSFEYMKHEKNEKRYFGFYLLVYGILVGLDFSSNLVTFYAFYELMTISSMPLVLHNQSKEAIMAGLKYLFYSFCGAYMVLFGLYFLNKYGTTLHFTAGGVLNLSALAGHETLLLVVAFFMIMGFGVKAGMFPLHAWLPTAHPVAPAPASAALSGIIVKAGVLGIIRVVYFMFGVDFLRGTWVQTTWLILTLITVFMGSMLAYREHVLKKRLAYSTVSQVSYILFGLAIMEPTSFTGSLLHVIAHAMIKCTLFLCAGAIIYMTGATRVEEMRGIGKKMPVTIWCYTIVSLGLIGIPPTGGFMSKWFLAVGSLNSGVSVFSWLGPVILLVSALLTAGYLLPITINGFLPGDDYDYASLEKKEPSKWMVVPILVLTILSVLVGVMPNGIVDFIQTIITAVF